MNPFQYFSIHSYTHSVTGQRPYRWTGTRSVVDSRSSNTLDTHASSSDAFLFLSLSLPFLSSGRGSARTRIDRDGDRRGRAPSAPSSAAAHRRRYRVLIDNWTRKNTRKTTTTTATAATRNAESIFSRGHGYCRGSDSIPAQGSN